MKCEGEGKQDRLEKDSGLDSELTNSEVGAEAAKKLNYSF